MKSAEADGDNKLNNLGPPPKYEAALPKGIPLRDKKPETRQKEEKELPKNILIIGETANGKSTLIRQMGVYAGMLDINVKIGHGNVSCTKNVGEYPISTTLRQFYLTDLNGGEIKKIPYSELVGLTDDDAIVVSEKSEEDDRVFNFKFFDTPGLDDSDGNDIEIMAEILGKIGELRHLNSVIYVRNLNKSFGTSFNRFYDYIVRSMPMLCNGLIIVHSGITVEKVDEGLGKKRDLVAERKEAFKIATKSKLDLAHFFMDNNPDETSPFAIMQSLNECFRLFKLLSTQLSLETSGLKLLKTLKMQNVDVHVQLVLGRLHSKLKSDWDDEVAKVNKSKASALRTSRDINRLNQRLEDYQTQLNELNTDSRIHLGTRSVSQDFSLITLFLKGNLKLDNVDVTFDSDFHICDVEKSANDGSTWVNVSQDETSWRGTLTAGMFRSIGGSATFYTTNRLKNKREIEILKTNIQELTQMRQFHEDTLRDMGGSDGVGLDEKAVRLGEDFERCGATIESIKRETFDVGLWPLLRKYYISLHPPTRDGIVEFVRVYDPKMADLM